MACDKLSCMKMILLTSFSALMASLLCTLAQPDTQVEKKKGAEDAPLGNANEVAVIKTSKGEMVVEFWPDVAPKAVANFKKLAREKFYDDTAFHCIVKGFAIQGGDPLTKDPAAQGRYGSGGPGYTIKDEFNDRKHVRGVLSMVRSALPDSAGSQFAIFLERAPILNSKSTAFGKLIKGEDVLMKIGDTPTTMNHAGTEKSVPTERITVESIRIVPAASVK